MNGIMVAQPASAKQHNTSSAAVPHRPQHKKAWLIPEALQMMTV